MKLHPLFIDGFAGGGGASTGIGQALGRDVDIAINHSETAIAIHKANHPDTEHHCTDIRMPFLPRMAVRGRHVGGAWFSPDCKEYSKAKGGPVKDRSIRALCDEVITWLRETLPDCGYLENVEEFEYAAPLDSEGVPMPDKKGAAFKKFVRLIRQLGYRVQWRLLVACKYGAPTSRKRLYMIFRRDGKPIVWPKPTHGPANDRQVLAGKLLPYRTAADCIDWSIECPSIFDRKKDLADASKRRVAHGVVRHVIEAAKTGKAYIVQKTDPVVGHITKFRKGSSGAGMGMPLPTVTANGVPSRPAGAVPLGVVETKIAPFISHGQHGGRNREADVPHHTIAASKKDTNGLVEASLAEIPFIDRQFGNSLPNPINEPLGATTAGGGGKSAQVSAFLSHFYGSDKAGGGGEVKAPLGVVRAGGTHHAVVAANMAQFNTNPNGTVNEGHPVRQPVSTLAARGPHQGVIETTLVEEGCLPPAMLERATMVAAFLVKYYGEGGQSQAANRPLDVVTTKARYAVVTVTIDAVTYVIVDIGLRMLKPRELARAQGFPDNYILNPVVRKFLRGRWVERPLTIAEQISAIGNSVCPPVARALVAANQPELCAYYMAEAA